MLSGPVHPTSLLLKGMIWAPKSTPILYPLLLSSLLPAASSVPPRGSFQSSKDKLSPMTLTVSFRVSHDNCLSPKLKQKIMAKDVTVLHSLPGADSVELTEHACLSVMYILRLLVHRSEQLCASFLLKITGIASQKTNSNSET